MKNNLSPGAWGIYACINFEIRVFFDYKIKEFLLQQSRGHNT